MELTARSTLSTWVGILFWVALSFAAAWVGSRFSPGRLIAHLVKPAFNIRPPGLCAGLDPSLSGDGDRRLAGLAGGRNGRGISPRRCSWYNWR